MEGNKPEGSINIDGRNIFIAELKERFPPSEENNENKYSGKCNYCGIEIGFSDPTQVKIIIKDSERIENRLSIYHNGCHDRYLRRTID